MREKATQFWSVVKVEQVKLRPQKCSCGTLHFWEAGLQLKDGQLNSKFLKYDLYPSLDLAIKISIECSYLSSSTSYAKSLFPSSLVNAVKSGS